MKFEVIIPQHVAKKIDRLDSSERDRVKGKLQQLESNPELGKPLMAVNLWSLRIGKYRAIYRIDRGKIQVLVIHIGHRKDAYKSLI